MTIAHDDIPETAHYYPDSNVILHSERETCDHRVMLAADAADGCRFCKAVEKYANYRPPVRLHLGPDVLGSCDSCGEDQPLRGGNLYKTPAGYLCERCLDEVDDCAKVGQ